MLRKRGVNWAPVPPLRAIYVRITCGLLTLAKARSYIGATARERHVIEVTRLDGSKLYVNADHIRKAEANPDTVITFADGVHMVVRETPAEVAAKVAAFRGQVIRLACQAPAEV